MTKKQIFFIIEFHTLQHQILLTLYITSEGKKYQKNYVGHM